MFAHIRTCTSTLTRSASSTLNIAQVLVRVSLIFSVLVCWLYTDARTSRPRDFSISHSQTSALAKPGKCRTSGDSLNVAPVSGACHRPTSIVAASCRHRAGSLSRAASSRSAARMRSCRCAAGQPRSAENVERGERRFPTLFHEHADRRQHRELGRRFGSAQVSSGPDAAPCLPWADRERSLRRENACRGGSSLPRRRAHKPRQAGSPHAHDSRSNRTERPRPLSETVEHSWRGLTPRYGPNSY